MIMQLRITEGGRSSSNGLVTAATALEALLRCVGYLHDVWKDGAKDSRPGCRDAGLRP